MFFTDLGLFARAEPRAPPIAARYHGATLARRAGRAAAAALASADSRFTPAACMNAPHSSLHSAQRFARAAFSVSHPIKTSKLILRPPHPAPPKTLLAQKNASSSAAGEHSNLRKQPDEPPSTKKASRKKHNALKVGWWERVDSDHRSYQAADLQSVPFGHSGTLPRHNSNIIPHPRGKVKGFSREKFFSAFRTVFSLFQ